MLYIPINAHKEFYTIYYCQLFLNNFNIIDKVIFFNFIYKQYKFLSYCLMYIKAQLLKVCKLLKIFRTKNF